ncbi:MAG: hypothetical protein HRT89_11650 [Lentisphaeria bacterium]|nr:hypothetical protein [Lentisphaeria bacterium]NQZ68710.1 hypothetical protein [Lentisphaeria bacterium]
MKLALSVLILSVITACGPSKDEIKHYEDIINVMNKHASSKNYAEAQTHYKRLQQETPKLGGWGKEQFSIAQSNLVFDITSMFNSSSFATINDKQLEQLKALVTVLNNDDLTSRMSVFEKRYTLEKAEHELFVNKGSILIALNLVSNIEVTEMFMSQVKGVLLHFYRSEYPDLEFTLKAKSETYGEINHTAKITCKTTQYKQEASFNTSTPTNNEILELYNAEGITISAMYSGNLNQKAQKKSNRISSHSFNSGLGKSKNLFKNPYKGLHALIRDCNIYKGLLATKSDIRKHLGLDE